MIWRSILWLSIIWLAPFMYFVLKNETKFKKNIIVGVTFPYEARSDGEVNARLKRFKKELGWVCLALFLLAIPGIFISSFGLSMTLWCMWILLCIIAPYIPYVFCNRDLKIIKETRGWKFGSEKIITVDTASVPEYKWLSPWFFIVPLALCLLPIIWDPEFWILYVADTLSVVIFWFGYRYLYINKPEQVDENLQLTAALTKVRRQNWAQLWIVCAYSMVLLNFGMFFTKEQPILMMLVIFAFSLIILVFVLRVEFHTRSVQEKLTVQSGRGAYVDDDDKWIWGIIYYYPQDKRSFVNDRTGMNITFNMAKRGGRGFAAGLILVLIAVPFIFPIVQASADKPITLEIVEEHVLAASGNTQYKVAIDDIAEIELLDALPEKMIRTNGTGMENLLKGRFSASTIGKMQVCLDPNFAPFLLLTTQSGENYLFGTRIPGEV